MDESPTKPSKYLLQQKRCHFASESSRLSHFVRFVLFSSSCLLVHSMPSSPSPSRQTKRTTIAMAPAGFGLRTQKRRCVFFFFNLSSYVFSPMQHRTLTSYIEMHVRPQRIRTTIGKTAYAVVFFIWVVFYLAP